jgi:hypothetical protein
MNTPVRAHTRSHDFKTPDLTHDEKKEVKISLQKRRHDTNGNPVYEVYIDGHNEKINGLRKLKAPHLYSIQSYSLQSDLQWCFPGKKLVLERIV